MLWSISHPHTCTSTPPRSAQTIVEYLKKRTATKEAAHEAKAAAKAASAAKKAALATAATAANQAAAAADGAEAGEGEEDGVAEVVSRAPAAVPSGPRLLPGGVNLVFSEEEFDAGVATLSCSYLSCV